MKTLISNHCQTISQLPSLYIPMIRQRFSHEKLEHFMVGFSIFFLCLPEGNPHDIPIWCLAKKCKKYQIPSYQRMIPMMFLYCVWYEIPNSQLPHRPSGCSQRPCNWRRNERWRNRAGLERFFFQCQIRGKNGKNRQILPWKLM